MTAETLRLSLTLTGGASLGAYQAGAVAALLTGVEALRRTDVPVVVDAVGGASSGSLVAMFAVECLLEGLDPVAVLHSAWVDRVSLDVLRSRDSRAPLSFERLRAQIDQALDPRDDDGRPIWRLDGHQREPLALHVTLTGLQGLTYDLPNGTGGEFAATTYADWSTFRLEPSRGVEQLLEPAGRSPLDAALASAANPAGFAPTMLDRSEDADTYRGLGISNFPESGCMWYADGGLVQAEPVGRTLMGARDVAGDAAGRRMHVVIDPRSEGPSGSVRWSDPDRVPSWTAGLARSLAIMPAQSVYDDLRRVVRDNARLQTVDEVAARLAGALGSEGEAAVRDIAGELSGDDAAEDENAEEVLRRLLADLCGVAGKEVVGVELISPLLLARTTEHDVPRLLAGEFLGTFGGFLDRRLRESDFALGWDSTRACLPAALERARLADGAVDTAVAAVDERRDRTWHDVDAGGTRPRDLPVSAQLAFARFGVQVAKVLAAGLVPHSVSAAPRRIADVLRRRRMSRRQEGAA